MRVQMSFEGNHPRAAIAAQADPRSQAGGRTSGSYAIVCQYSQRTNFGDPRIALDHLLLNRFAQV